MIKLYIALLLPIVEKIFNVFYFVSMVTSIIFVIGANNDKAIECALITYILYVFMSIIGHIQSYLYDDDEFFDMMFRYEEELKDKDNNDN